MIQAFEAADTFRRSDLLRPSGEAMSTTLSGTPFFTEKIGSVAKDLSVLAAILDRSGVIVAVNAQWQRFGDVRGQTFPEYGAVGESYFRNCAFADPLSPRLIRGLAQVMSGERDRLTLLYSLNDPRNDRKLHILLLAFPHPEIPGHTAVMHIDVTVLVSILTLFPCEEPAHGPAASGHSARSAVSTTHGTDDALIGLIEEASRMRNEPHGQIQGKEPHPSFSRRQIDVLALMIKGMTNAEIARELGLSLNTVKVYVSGILVRLGLQTRAQVLHWALTLEQGSGDD